MRTDVHLITNLAQVSGAENMMLRIIEHNRLKPKVQQVVISLMSISDEVKNRLPSNVDVYALNANSGITMLLSSLKVAKLLKGKGNLYCWMYHSNVIGAIAKIFLLGRVNVIWGVRHSLDDYDGESKSTKLAILAGRLLRKIPNKIIYCSQRAQEQHEAFGYGGKDKSIYIPNGYNFFKCVERPFSSEPLIFGAAGRFHEAKDYNTLIEAIAPILEKMPEAKLEMCGREVTGQNTQLTRMIERAGINKKQVDLQGQITDMAAFYNNVDVFILSSKTEGFPNVLAEAAAYGCAVFSTDVGDASIIVNNCNHIVPIADSSALTQVIEKYISLPCEQRKNIAYSTSQYVRSQFSISHVADQFFALGK
ncbi:glycosyltransferase [Vibrio jasicida]|uniref:glycosyltransferase n=1 Tax=Vibrio jasicida TaxID=766224 RepID=UPI00148D9AB4|nr:glycosyltransferase [Vibrio jasicida]NOJ20346.1 glycosyltransferase [Vibrio jasicida]